LKESVLQYKILRYIESLPNSYVIKVVVANKAGIPDILACIDGFFVAIEVKSTKGIVSKLQEINIKKIQKARGFATICYSWEEFLIFIKIILDKQFKLT